MLEANDAIDTALLQILLHRSLTLTLTIQI